MERLLRELERLPGVGPRTAERLAYHLLRSGAESSRALSRAIEVACEAIRPCGICYHLTDVDPCALCQDEERDRTRVLVVSQPKDLEAMEKAGWRGLYHVLLGSLSLQEGGAGADEPTVRALRKRLQGGDIREVILGTNPDLEGDGTALVLAEMISQIASKDLRVSRLARGVPAGASIEYTNPAVLAEAIEERRLLPREVEA